MEINIVHLSDIHYQENWQEDQGLVLNEFFKDLTKQISQLEKSKTFFAFSGDLVQKGSDNNLFSSFYNFFDSKLSEIGIDKTHRICVPGNHDISQDSIKNNYINHEAIVSQILPEKIFNDYVSNPTSNIFNEKFVNYCNFEQQFADFGILSDTNCGKGWELADNLGIYCLNSSFCSSGGLSIDGSKIDDKGRLLIGTRSIQSWINEKDLQFRILVMHHPISSFSDWAQKALKSILNNNFCLLLSGHAHDQDIYHIVHQDKSIIECSAPPLFTKKEDNLGYSIVQLNTNSGVTGIVYRQWTKYRSFVSGVNFSNTDDGKVTITLPKSNQQSSTQSSLINENERLSRILETYFDNSLKTFNVQPIIWIEPLLHTKSELSIKGNRKLKDELPISIQTIVNNPRSLYIKAFPQFGLTCLARYFCKEAWNNNKEFWLYIDSRTIETHTISKFIETELNIFGIKLVDVKCVVLDSWSMLEKKSSLLLQKLSELFINTPLIVLQTIDDTRFLETPNPEVNNRDLKFITSGRTHGHRYGHILLSIMTKDILEK